MNATKSSLALVLGISLLAACSSAGSVSSSPTTSSTGNVPASDGPAAQQLCEKPLGAQNVVSFGPLTTVGELRGMKQGPGFEPAKGAFPELPDSAVASFCWTGGNGKYDSFGVTLDDQQISLGGMDGVTSAPSGPPVIP